jgi:hypothetical protein
MCVCAHVTTKKTDMQLEVWLYVANMYLCAVQLLTMYLKLVDLDHMHSLNITALHITSLSESLFTTNFMDKSPS